MFSGLFPSGAGQAPAVDGAAQASVGYAARAGGIWATATENATATYHNMGAGSSASDDPLATRRAKEVCGPDDDGGPGTASFGTKASALFDRGHTAVAAAQAGFAAKSQEMLAAGHSGLMHFGEATPVLTKDRLDLFALASAGFGATGAALERRRAEAYDAMFVLSGPLRMQLLLALREMVKEAATADPEMPGFVEGRLATLVDRLWADIIIYQEKMVEDARLAATGRIPTDHAELALVGPHLLICSPFWWRAHILYYYLPFDRSIWGKIRSPAWWLLTMLSLMSMFGIRIIFHFVLLILILRGCPADEFQLVNFIIGFKGTQVISSGIVMSVVACTQLFMCVHSHEHHNCDKVGPGVNFNIFWGIVDFVGNWVLVWIAFLFLPCSDDTAGSRDLDGAIADMDDASEAAMLTDNDSDGGSSIGVVRRSLYSVCCSRRCCRHTYDPSRGGRLAGLLVYDLICAALSLFVLVQLARMDVSHGRPGGEPEVEVPFSKWKDIKTVVMQDFQTWKFHMAFFMTRIFYAYSALPFLVFSIPVLSSILTHTRSTGYNLQGVCVPFQLPPMPPKEKGH